MDDSYKDLSDRRIAQVDTYVCGVESGQATTLARAVEKLVTAADQVGLTADDLIGFLRSGMSVADLLDYVDSKMRQQLQ